MHKEQIFLCGDDENICTDLISDLKSLGNEIVYLPHHDAFQDMASLSQTKKIIQVTKFSTFSASAALMGDKPIEQ